MTLTPQDRTVLNHLRTVGNITRLEGMYLYHIAHLAERVASLRRAGYNVGTTRKRDATGKLYASYALETA